ncbi:hypothetical protein BGX31_007855 [Mortierella sp. GBA43]|nr:hypothetical protein BGX31_007855 [Mortierella sp. GBA43]
MASNIGNSGNTIAVDEDSVAASVKRPRGRPRKMTLSAVQASSSMQSSNSALEKSPQSAVSPTSSQTESPTEQTHDASMQTLVAKCESCTKESVRIYKIGKLSVCKDCEALVRVASGSSRRRSATTSTASATSPTSDSASESHLQASSDNATGQGNSSIETIMSSSTSPNARSGPEAAAAPQNATRSKTRKPKATQGAEATPSKSSPEQPQTANSSSSGQRRRGRAAKTVDSGNQNPDTQGPKDSGSTSAAANDDTSPKPESKESSGRASGARFQTTGAFLTRTASKLLGSQSTGGGDCNIHGYVYGRPVKVRHIDGTQYFGTMISLASGKIRIHFDGWSEEWDEWLASDSRRLQLLDEEEMKQREAFLETINGESGTFPIQEFTPKQPPKTLAKPLPKYLTKLSKAEKQAASSNQSKNAPTDKKSSASTSKRKLSLSEQGDISKETTERADKRAKKGSKGQRSNATSSKPAVTPTTRQERSSAHSSTSAHANTATASKGAPSDTLAKVQEGPTLTSSGTETSKNIGVKASALDRPTSRSRSASAQSTAVHRKRQSGAVSTPPSTTQRLNPVDSNEPNMEQSHLGADALPEVQGNELSVQASRPSKQPKARRNRAKKSPTEEEPTTPVPIGQDQPSPSPVNSIDQRPCDAGTQDGNGELATESARDGSNEDNKGDDIETETPPAPLLYPTLGNPIQLNLKPREIVQFEYSDEEGEIRGIIHRVLDTGLIRNRPIVHPIENSLGTSRVFKTTTKKPTNDDENGQKNGSDHDDDGGGGGNDNDGGPSPKFPTKAAERFAAIIEARAIRRGQSSQAIPPNVPVTRNDSEALNQAREMAMRNMTNAPIVQCLRQVIYEDLDRTNPFEKRKQKLSGVLTGSKLAKHKRLHSLTKKDFGNLNIADLSEITFNEAGYVETAAALKTKSTVKSYQKVTKKRKERHVLKELTESYFQQDENQINGKGIFESLRSLTGTKKQKRVLADDHIVFLRRVMVPGTRIRARDKQMDWLTAVIRDVKNSRVLVHYEGFHDFFNEWIDINSERLKYDPTLEQNPKGTAGDEQYLPSPATTSTPVNQTPPMFVEPIIELSASSTSGTDLAALADSVPSEDGSTEVHCVQCQVKISQFRIYCMYCEVQAKTEGSGRSPFNLCLWCFSNVFPQYHDHPRSSFATKVIVGPRGVRPVKGGIITRFEKDIMDTTFKEPDKPDAESIQAMQLEAMMRLESDQPFFTMDQWKSRKVCAFCNDDGTSKDHFIGPYPFLLASTNRYGDAKKRHFWAHDSCARHSPEVIQGKDGTWYNVSMAMRRGRTVKCTSCKEKGATIGCFDPKCGRSFHVPCTGKPKSYFEDGVIFWCPQHERLLLQKDAYHDTFSCDKCSKILGVNPWQTCVKCSSDFFHTFDLCQQCFSLDEIEHEHGKDDFKSTSLELIYQERLEKEAAQAPEPDESAPVKKKPPSYKPKMRSLSRMVCSYCWSVTSVKWRKGYNGVLMCEDCFLAGPLNEIPMQPPLRIEGTPGDLESDKTSTSTLKEENDRRAGLYATSAEDYSHTPYLTRTSVSADRFDHSSSQAVYLDSYGPAENQLFSLPIDTTYYDIPGRAPRWATHSGTDYHGTWLPQTVRRAVLKYTKPNEKILSNFLGRGTDAIECFLLGRCCTGVDINPAAITLSIRNCSFAIPPDGTIKAEHRPTILQGDSRKLTGPLFENESFDHVLSHPPYKDCVAYSTHIDGDLSRFGSSIEFQREMRSVIQETYRLLRMGRRCTLGIGDNREHCFYIPVSFQMIRQYINEGFEVEEFIVKRQRYCSMFGLGTYLCVQFDFLCFTHEFVVTLRKIPKNQIDTMILEPDRQADFTLLDNLRITSTTRAVPSCPIERKSVVMGSVWTFKPTQEYDFPTLCVSRMVERFGKNESNWEELKLEFDLKESTEVQVIERDVAPPAEVPPTVDEDMVSYERDRLQQIQENNRMLLALGLITELSESSDDIGHQIKISKDAPCYPPPAQTVLRLVAHIPGVLLSPEQMPVYRTAIMHLAIQALENLPVTGMFIVGTQDIRADSGKLIPLAMLVLEDIIRVVGDDCLKLKELIEAVPDGYQRDRRKTTCMEEYPGEICAAFEENPTTHLPIVHACYLVFTKVKEKEPLGTSSTTAASVDAEV